MSVRETVADDGATVESRLDFGPYGDVRASGSGVESDHEFTGHFEDEDLAMTHFRAYDEQTGRWLSRDPIGMKDSLNLYKYVRGQPVRYRDPDGRYTDTYTECVKKHGPAGCGGPMPPPPPNPAPAPFLLCFFFPSLCDPTPPCETASKSDKWTCTASCNVEGTAPHCTGRVIGGPSLDPSEGAACRAAKRVATQSAPAGCYARHCQCRCTKR